MSKNEKEVLERGTTDIAIANIFEQDASGGFEGMGQDDLALPFLRLLAANSPEIGELEGALPGMIYNTVTGELHDGKSGITVIPCAYVRQYIEWTPRGQGSGAPVAVYPATSDILHLAPSAPVGIKVDQHGLVLGLGALQGSRPIVFKFNALAEGSAQYGGRKKCGKEGTHSPKVPKILRWAALGNSLCVPRHHSPNELKGNRLRPLKLHRTLALLKSGEFRGKFRMRRRQGIHPEVVFERREVDQGLAAQRVGGHSITKVLDGLWGGAANERSQFVGPLALGYRQCAEVGVDGQGSGIFDLKLIQKQCSARI